MTKPVNFDPAFDPNNFSSDPTLAPINPFLPLALGNTWTYAHSDGAENTVTVVGTILIDGVTCFAVTDNEKDADGNFTELTTDYFATDNSGNVWYFGEDTVELPSGDTAGTWRAGEVPEDGDETALPGVIMPAPDNLAVSLTYHEENAAPVALDRASVKSLSAKVNLGDLGSFTDALKTKNDTALEHGHVEKKYYVAGLGPVLIRGGNIVEQLVSTNVAPAVQNLAQAMASFSAPKSSSAPDFVTNGHNDHSSSQAMLAPAGHDGGGRHDLG